MVKILMDVNSVLILLDMIDLHHLEEDNDQDPEVVIEDDQDRGIEEEDHVADLAIVDVEVAQDHATAEEDPVLDPDLEIGHAIDQEADQEDEVDPEANPKVEVEAKRLLGRRVAQNLDPNHEADLVQETPVTDELN